MLIIKYGDQELEIIGPQRRWRKERRERKKEIKTDIERALGDAGINYESMTPREVEEYRRTWLASFAPAGENLCELRRRLYLDDRRYAAFLWHLFSYECVPVPEPDESRRLFDDTKKDNAVLIINTEDRGYRVSLLSALTSDFLDRDCWYDVTVTAADFSWTYSKTHEPYCGPYYYKP